MNAPTVTPTDTTSEAPRSRNRTALAIHIASSMIALCFIMTFWLASVAAETIGGPGLVLQVMTGFLYGLLVLIPALAASGISGRAISRRTPGQSVKAQRLQWAALTGVLVLIPCAVLLWYWARRGDLGHAFTAVQGLELLGGASNIRLLVLNARLGAAILGRSAQPAHRDRGLAAT